jgi:hypothetical protein
MSSGGIDVTEKWQRTALWYQRSAELLGESDEKSLRPADVAKPIRVFILNDFAYKLRPALAEPLERVVDVVYGEHHAQVAESVHRGVPVIRNDRRGEKAGELEAAVAVGRTHHGNLDALIAQSGDTSGPISLDRGAAFELEAELAKEINRRGEVIDHDSDVVHACERHVSTLQSGAWSDNSPPRDTNTHREKTPTHVCQNRKCQQCVLRDGVSLPN